MTRSRTGAMLSIVIPMHDEAEVLDVLFRREAVAVALDGRLCARDGTQRERQGRDDASDAVRGSQLSSHDALLCKDQATREYSNFGAKRLAVSLATDTGSPSGRTLR